MRLERRFRLFGFPVLMAGLGTVMLLVGVVVIDRAALGDRLLAAFGRHAVGHVLAVHPADAWLPGENGARAEGFVVDVGVPAPSGTFETYSYRAATAPAVGDAAPVVIGPWSIRARAEPSAPLNAPGLLLALPALALASAGFLAAAVSALFALTGLPRYPGTRLCFARIVARRAEGALIVVDTATGARETLVKAPLDKALFTAQGLAVLTHARRPDWVEPLPADGVPAGFAAWAPTETLAAALQAWRDRDDSRRSEAA